MEDQIFQALVGQVQSGGQPPGDVQSATVNALRQQHDLGQLYSMSPTLSKVGQSMQTGALNSAKEIGDRRQQGLTRTRQAEQDRLAKDKYDQTLLGYDGIQWIEKNGEPLAMGRNKRTGAFEPVPNTEGMKPHTKKYGSSVFRSMNVPGLKEAGFRMNDEGQIMAPNGKIYDTQEEFAAEFPDLAGEALANLKSKNFETQRGTDTAKEIQTAIDGHVETNGRLSNTANTLDTILSALDAGALSGNISDMFKTVDNSTAQLESALSNLTLDSLTQYKLTPVSDKDLEYVRKGAAPNLSAGGLKRWATHKKEAVKRMLEANKFMEDWIAANERMPRGEDRAYVEKQVGKILKGDGFKFAFDLDAEEKREAQYRKDNAPIPRPSWIKEGDPRWNALTPEEKQQVIKAREG